MEAEQEVEPELEAEQEAEPEPEVEAGSGGWRSLAIPTGNRDNVADGIISASPRGGSGSLKSILDSATGKETAKKTG